MAEYIDRDALKDRMVNFVPPFINESNQAYVDGLTDAYTLICQAPAADVVERKIGKWIYWQNDPGANVYECSVCHEPLTLNEWTPKENNFNYCPFCGLPMIGGDDDV